MTRLCRDGETSCLIDHATLELRLRTTRRGCLDTHISALRASHDSLFSVSGRRGCEQSPQPNSIFVGHGDHSLDERYDLMFLESIDAIFRSSKEDLGDAGLWNSSSEFSR